MKTKSAIAIFILISILSIGCGEKLMIITSTRHGVGAEMIMPLDRKLKRMLKDSTNIDVRIVKRSKLYAE